MNDITNKHLFITMIIIGIITIAFIIPLHGTVSPYPYGTLGASALDGTSGYNYVRNNNLDLSIGRSGVYTPYLNTNYAVSPFRTSNTTTVTSSSVVPSTTQSYSYTTYEQVSGGDYYYTGGSVGYVPPGCEGNAMYSATTGEVCG